MVPVIRFQTDWMVCGQDKKLIGTCYSCIVVCKHKTYLSVFWSQIFERIYTSTSDLCFIVREVAKFSNMKLET